MIFHDACYGHRFSRPRTSKASLSTIVERPERIRAIVLGAATAYVLLGGRHSGAENAPHPHTQPGAAPFILRKSSRRVPLSSLAVTTVHGTSWMSELQEMCNSAEARLTANGKELERPKGEIDSDGTEKPRLHEGDLYLCAESLEAFEGALGGVFDAVDSVFNQNGPRRCFACVRPPGHHCSSDYPSGFCWLNNVHVGISYGASAHGLTHAAIFDFDLHHGDGSQSIAWDHNAKVATMPKNAHLSKKTRIGYYSLHDINSYPCEWGDEEKVRNASLCIENAHGQNIWNVHLQPWKTDAEFWKLYNERYSVLLEKMRAFLRYENERLQSLGHGQRSKGVIFISAGFDASEWEGQGMQRHKVNVPTDFYARVTRDIVELSNEPGLGVNGRVISVLEGGYSDRALMSGALSHICGLAGKSFSEGTSAAGGGSRPTPASADGPSMSEIDPPLQKPKYSDDWWSPVRLEALESVANPPAATLARKPRGGAPPTYQTPTQSFMTKVVSPPTYQRSISGSFTRQSPVPIHKPPTPPPPEVDWIVASQELCQLLIPQGRPTRSCRPEDLNAKATEARKNRQSLVGALPELPIEEMQKMHLRDKAAKPSNVENEDTRSMSGASASRRRTIGGNELAEKQPVRASRRRVSVASSILSNSDESSANGSTQESNILNPPKQRAPPKSRVTKKAPVKPPVPRMPSTGNMAGILPKPETLTDITSPPAQDAIDTEIADLASNVKKMSIKLNMPSREEYEAREARRPVAAPETKKSAVARAPRKPPIKKPAREIAKTTNAKTQPSPKFDQTSTMHPEVQIPTVKPSPQASTVQPALEQNPAASNVPPNDFIPIPFPPSSAHVSSVTSSPSFQAPDTVAVSATTGPSGSDPTTLPTFEPNPPQLPHNSTPPGRPLPSVTASAPSSIFTSPRLARNNLPVFTSSSPIPFGPSKAAATQIPSEKTTNLLAEEEAEERLAS